jgi:hypothetical protein
MTEHAEQALLFEWAYRQTSFYPDLVMLFAVPNGAKMPYSRNEDGTRYSNHAMYMKAEGLTPGIPDVALMAPKGGFHGMFIEMKYGKNKLSTEQSAWLSRLRKQGYYCIVAYSFEEAQKSIEAYLEERIPHE